MVKHNTLATSEYALLDHETHNPRPNYWAAFLWNKLMGTKVYDAGASVEGLDVFVHNLKSESQGYPILVINAKNSPSSFDIPAATEQYLLASNDILPKEVQLNGEVLQLLSNDTLPEIKGKKAEAGRVQLPPRFEKDLMEAEDKLGQAERELKRTTEILESGKLPEHKETYQFMNESNKGILKGYRSTRDRYADYISQIKDFSQRDSVLFFKFFTGQDLKMVMEL